MASNPVQPAEPDAGIILDPDAPGTVTQPRKGERAIRIRQMATRYPELSPSAIAKRVGCSHQNVSGVLASFLANKPYAELQDFRDNKAEVFEAVQYRTLASLTEADIANASYLQRITGAAILQDKIALQRGQPTSIHVHALVDVLDALRRRDQE